MTSRQVSEEMVERGTAALERADFEDAIEILGSAAVEDSNNARAWFYLGVCYLETGQSDVAADSFNRAIAADPQYADAHYLLGTSMGSSGQIDMAADCYRRALAIDAGHYKAEEFLIRTEAMLASREHYRTALQLIYEGKRGPDWMNRAVRELLHSVAIFTESPARNELPRIAKEVTDAGNRRPVHDVPDSDGPFWRRAIRRGEQAYDRKNWPEAAASYHEALDLSAGHGFIHHALGLIYFSLGDTDGGTRSWQRAIDLDPDYDYSSIGRLAGAD